MKVRVAILVMAVILGLSANAFANALLVENLLPWNWNSNSDTLTAIGIAYNKIGSDQLASTDLSAYTFVVFSSVQDQNFYDDVAANKAAVDSYVANGGTLIAHSALWGWPANGIWTAPNFLPGGVNRVQEYSNSVNITDPLSPIVSGPYGTLTEAEFQAWDYTTHGYFTNLVAGTEIALDLNDINKPIYITYPFGLGEVRASMMTVEWGENDAFNTRYIFRENEFYAGQFVPPQDNVVPEPTTMLLFGLGLAGLAFKRKKLS